MVCAAQGCGCTRQRYRQRRPAESYLSAKGFTLIELLVVIFILAVLAVVTVLAIGPFNERTKTKACMSEKVALESAIETYRAREGAHPRGGAAGLAQLQTAGTGADESTSEPLLKAAPSYWTLNDAGDGMVRTGRPADNCTS